MFPDNGVTYVPGCSARVRLEIATLRAAVCPDRETIFPLCLEARPEAPFGVALEPLCGTQGIEVTLVYEYSDLH
jgi:hypothetical protein